MSNRTLKDQRALARKGNGATPETGAAERRSERRARAAPDKHAARRNRPKLASGRAAMNITAVVHQRTWNFVRHYLQLFLFARAQVGTYRLVQVAALDMTAAIAQGGILFLAATLASVMQDGGAQLQKFGLGFIAGHTLTILIAFCIPTLLLLLYSSFAAFLAAKYSRRCGRTTQMELARQFLIHAEWLHSPHLADIVPDTGRLKQFFGRDLRQAGKSIEKMLRLMQPIVYFVLALTAALSLEPFLSAALLVIASVMLPFFYLLSRRIQANAFNFYESQRKQSGRVISNLTDQLQETNVGQASQLDHDWLDRQSAYQEYLDTYDQFRLASDYMALRASLLRSVLIVCGLIAFGWLAMEGQRSWSALVIYIGSLVFLTTGLQKFLTISTILIRYYPQTRFAAAIIERLRTASLSAEVAPEPPDKIELKARSRITGSQQRHTIAKGGLAILLTKMPLQRLSFQRFLRPVRRASDAPPGLWNAAAFLAYLQPPPHNTVAGAVLGQGASESKRAWLENFLARAPNCQKFLPDGLETELTEERWNSLPERGKAVLQLASVCSDARGVLFLDAEFAAKLPEDLIRDLPRTQEVHYVFIVSSSLDLPLEVDHYLVADERVIIGLGDASWLEAQRETIAPLVDRKHDGRLDDDDDDDDD